VARPLHVGPTIPHDNTIPTDRWPVSYRYNIQYCQISQSKTVEVPLAPNFLTNYTGGFGDWNRKRNGRRAGTRREGSTKGQGSADEEIEYQCSKCTRNVVTRRYVDGRISVVIVFPHTVSSTRSMERLYREMSTVQQVSGVHKAVSDLHISGAQRRDRP
jgi:hypothetical protein